MAVFVGMGVIMLMGVLQFDGIFKNKCPTRNMKFTRHNRIALGHTQTVQYIAAITV